VKGSQEAKNIFMCCALSKTSKRFHGEDSCRSVWDCDTV